MAKGIPTGRPLAYVIGKFNPILLGWRNYYRYATRAWRDFARLDRWIWERVGRWLRKKHRKVSWRTLRHRFTTNARGQRLRWADGSKRLRLLREGGTMRYPHRGIEKPNGWNAVQRRDQRESMAGFWDAFGRPNWG